MNVAPTTCVMSAATALKQTCLFEDYLLKSCLCGETEVSLSPGLLRIAAHKPFRGAGIRDVVLLHGITTGLERMWVHRPG